MLTIPTWLKMTNGMVALAGVAFGLLVMFSPVALAPPVGCAIIGLFIFPAVQAWKGGALAVMTLLYFGSSLTALILGWMTMPEGAEVPTFSMSLWSTAVACVLLLPSFFCLRWHERSKGAGGQHGHPLEGG